MNCWGSAWYEFTKHIALYGFDMVVVVWNEGWLLFIPSLFCYGKALVSKFQSIIPDWMVGEAGSAGPRVHVHSLADQRSKWRHFYSF